MHDTKSAVVTGAIGWANSVLSIAAIKLSLTIPEATTLLFVTVPVGIWSWLRLIDYVKNRKTAHARTDSDTPAG